MVVGNDQQSRVVNSKDKTELKVLNHLQWNVRCDLPLLQESINPKESQQIYDSLLRIMLIVQQQIFFLFNHGVMYDCRNRIC